VGLAVVGLLSLTALSGLEDWIPAARVQRAAREVASLLEWSRWQAMAHGSAYLVRVDSEAERFVVLREGAGEGGSALEVRQLELREAFPGVVLGTAPATYRTSGCRYVQASGVHLLNDLVRFLPHGSSDRCGSIYLIPEDDLPGRQDRMAAVSLLLSTGRVQLWRYDPLAVSPCAHAGVWVSIY
jgi:Tfp pilus assembly protein FimT